MSRENVEVVHGLFGNTNARDFQAVMEAYADDVVLSLHGGVEFVGAMGAEGKEAVGEWFGDWFRTFDRDYHFEIEETRDWGDRVFLIATHRGRGRVSGAPIEQRAAWIYTLRAGKVIRCDAYGTPKEALEAAGLSE